MGRYHSTRGEIRACSSHRLAKSVLSTDLEPPRRGTQGWRRPAPGLCAESCGANMAGAAAATSRGGRGGAGEGEAGLVMEGRGRAGEG